MLFCTLYLFFVSGENITLVMIGILVLRLNMQTMANIPYHINQLVFPTEYRAIASGVMNFGGRSIGALAMIICEYTSQPVFYILLMNVFTLFICDSMLSEPEEARVN